VNSGNANGKSTPSLVSNPLKFLNTSWIVDDPNLDLEAVSLTRVSKNFNGLLTREGVDFPLALPEFTLVAGRTYLFELYSAPVVNASKAASGKVSITVNTPPALGTFAITPSNTLIYQVIKLAKNVYLQ
jgi:hypothetical protein